MKKFLVSHLWDAFVKEFPVLSRLPFLGYWSFGYWTRAYLDAKWPEADIDFSLKPGDVVLRRGWTMGQFTVLDVNWSLGVAAVKYGYAGTVSVLPVSGFYRV
jgi:hypothetical protein